MALSMTLSRRLTYLVLALFLVAIVAAEVGILPSGPSEWATFADWAR